MRRPPELRLPRARRWPWTAVVVSLALHSLLLLVHVRGRLPEPPPRPTRIIALEPPSAPRAFAMPFVAAGPASRGRPRT
ncbi:MAG TPA: hypothetical protein VNK43_11155, partial [Gemmatimonadales bacterium]|nr:hypothetical protein [Gemmatimonadales bacterium]